MSCKGGGSRFSGNIHVYSLRSRSIRGLSVPARGEAVEVLACIMGRGKKEEACEGRRRGDERRDGIRTRRRLR